MAAKRVTMFDPPPLDDSKAPIENVLELTPILDIGPVGYAQAHPFSLIGSYCQTELRWRG